MKITWSGLPTLMVTILLALAAGSPARAYHSSDYSPSDWKISLSELLRAIQFYNVGEYSCGDGTEDGFVPGTGDHSCPSHASDYNPQDWSINLSELLRLIQFYNLCGYYEETTAEDGYSPSGCNDPRVPPNAPVNFKAVKDDSNIILTWDEVSSAVSYNLYRAEVSGLTKDNFDTLKGGKRIEAVSSPYTDTNTSNGARYYYLLTAENSGGEGPASLLLAATMYSIGWHLQSPQPSGDHLNAVWFANASEGWIVGESGTILHTDDGGANWTEQLSPVYTSLHDVTFLDSDTGWAVGDGGTVLSTVDGGLNWRIEASSAEDHRLLTVVFRDSKNGWIAGAEYSAPILRTSDGGKTWSRSGYESSEYLATMAYVQEAEIWAVSWDANSGANLWKSFDAGTSWTSAGIFQEYGGLNSLTVSSPQVAALICYPGICQTKDGGAGWTKTYSGSVYYPLLGLAFVDDFNGWAVGWRGRIVHTSDGGGSWSMQDSNVDEALLDVAAVDAQTAWAVGAGGTILHTTNGGATWIPQHHRTTASPIFPRIFFLDEQVGWSNNGGILHATTDGGLTWNPIWSVTNTNKIVFVGQNFGWALNGLRYFFYRTTDGGITWSEGARVGSQVMDFTFASASVGWAVGGSGFIAKTSDGGLSWVPQPSGTGEHFLGVVAMDELNAWAVGTSGVIKHTIDGGTTWTTQMSGTTRDLRDIDAVDVMHAWAVCTGSSSEVATILRTSDGGNTWTKVEPPWFGGFEGVRFADSLHGWVINGGVTPSGVFAKVAHTKDGGITWAPQFIRASDYIYSICPLDANTAFLGGSGLYKTNTGGD